MLRQARIENARDVRMRGKPLRQRQRAPGLRGCAQGKRAHPAQEQEGLERTQNGAMGPANGRDLFPQRVGAGGRQGAGDHVGMPVEHLRSGMHHDVCSQCERAGVDRRGDRRIHRKASAGVAETFGGLLENARRSAETLPELGSAVADLQTQAIAMTRELERFGDEMAPAQPAGSRASRA